MFHSTRLILTLWYVLIAVFITGFFSVLMYNGFRFEFERGIQRQKAITSTQLPPQCLSSDDQENSNIPMKRFDPQIIEEIKEHVLTQILTIDAIIVFFSALGGYFLAGRTLRPIKKMVSEQNRFITDSSHELRTPLTAARTSLEVGLRDKALTLEQAKELLRSNLEDITNMQTLSDKLLLLAQYQKQNSHIPFTTISLLETLQQSVDKVMPLAKQKNISISVTPKEYTVIANKDMLEELFIILLDNAIKYSPDNSKIVVSSKKIDKSIAIQIKDQGKGIDKKDIPYIFDRFYRTDKSRSKKNVRGYGLGLSIAKKIVNIHHGIIHVASKVGEGSTFTIQLPYNKKSKSNESK
jgi:two-component system, OmpR family, sensor histidine kinase CiaH